jgi:hypothetical protein
VRINATAVTKLNGITVFNSSETVQLTIDKYLARGSTKKSTKCYGCSEQKDILRSIIRHPSVLHMFFGNGTQTMWPNFLEKQITFGTVEYEICGAIYGSNSHFIFRYFRNGKVFEADGMREHFTSTREYRVREAMSVEIKEPYHIALAGLIQVKIINNKKISKYTICDVFYMKI